MSIRHSIATALFRTARSVEPPAPVTEKQINFIGILCERLDEPVPDMSTMTRHQGSELITALIARRDAA